MSEKYTTLHPKGDTSIDLYPNIKAANIPDNSIGANKIYPNAIGNPQLAPNAVGYNNIQGGAVYTIHIHDGAVTSDKIGSGAVTTAKLDTNSVSRDKIIDGAINAAKIEDGTITTAKMASRLYNYTWDFNFTHAAVDYTIFLDLNNSTYFLNPNAVTNAQFIAMWDAHYSDTPKRFIGLDKTNNKNVYFELTWMADDSEFIVNIIDDNNWTSALLTDIDFVLVDGYKTILF